MFLWVWFVDIKESLYFLKFLIGIKRFRKCFILQAQFLQREYFLLQCFDFLALFQYDLILNALTLLGLGQLQLYLHKRLLFIELTMTLLQQLVLLDQVSHSFPLITIKWLFKVVPSPILDICTGSISLGFGRRRSQSFCDTSSDAGDARADEARQWWWGIFDIRRGIFGSCSRSSWWEKAE